MMKYLTMVSILVIASGCSTLKTVELEQEQLHQQISAGKITQVGDLVEIVTSDGMRHEFTVKAITEDRIMGKKKIYIGANSYEYQDFDIPITDIVTLEIRVEEPKKTAALLAGGTIAWVAAIFITLAFAY